MLWILEFVLLLNSSTPIRNSNSSLLIKHIQQTDQRSVYFCAWTVLDLLTYDMCMQKLWGLLRSAFRSVLWRLFWLDGITDEHCNTNSEKKKIIWCLQYDLSFRTFKLWCLKMKSELEVCTKSETLMSTLKVTSSENTKQICLCIISCCIFINSRLNCTDLDVHMNHNNISQNLSAHSLSVSRRSKDKQLSSEVLHICAMITQSFDYAETTDSD